MGSIAFRTFHKQLDLSSLGKIIELPVFASWKAGEPRKTPQGTVLPGVREQSYWCTRVDWIDSKIADEFIFRVMSALELHVEWRTFVADGVRAEFYVCLSPGDTNSVEFNRESLGRMSKLGVGVQIEAMTQS